MSGPSDTELTISRLWKVSRTIHELIRDRGYAVAEDEINLSLDQFKLQFGRAGGIVDRTSLGFWAHLRNDPSSQIYVYFCDERNVSIKDMKKLLIILDEKDIHQAIVIYPQTMTPAARKLVAGLPGYHLEEFAETELLVNITQHTLVPQHEILSAEEKRLLLERYRLKETQLPRIQIADPVARYYGLRRGQVVKIIRPSETAGRYTSYRICF
ncbi:DNA-directed RNA polymerases II 24 kDa polypeptide (RNA polymerase II subunit 5) [Serendipita sp. 411]|nr:DNA-directed RNA polymerases II 24 kDa polypeptide (RNA polymerase II subunit 5) [Serendipita sp. 401]KAG8839209.1 DNA-directed RNA polymerases II 24 kDa polypeptide (RNA polymerase II subunit 5) [Serendipita sp. 400]KAG8858584.1 DNA-directed RNA polymerases II 24 kDa polypeptide (RNA polymerase II subunit 5) [Serendipita sp. 411]KAG9053129.1 DNA-directed RNA polymerases II 24 kDa polypeptide (RNA polymerase II subunit 5) [Serendipita sp. 407]